MDFEVSFQHFRGFNQQGFVPVRPLTLLVGENSAGKTSYLAAVFYLHRLLTGSPEASFNSEPFQLGTFEQIAHNRGGRAGRARDFRIAIRKRVAPRGKENAVPATQSRLVTLNLTFHGVESNTILRDFELNIGRSSLTSRLEQGKAVYEFTGSKGESSDLSKTLRRFPPIQEIGFRYLPMLLHDATMWRRHRKEVGGEDVDEVSGIDETFLAYVEAFLDSFQQPLQATSAIRTKPLRTYTPGTEAEDSEGSHVPFEMAKLSRRRNKSEWEKIKGSLERFGQQSGLFGEVEVRSFGRTAGDPFQLEFSSAGPKRNIVDLGYGTSQVLPIIYESAKSPEYKSFLIQQPEVHLHPKAQAALAEFFVSAHLSEGQDFLLETHSDFIVDRVRTAVRRGDLSRRDVSLLFFQRERLENRVIPIDLNDDGEPVSPPDQYRSFFVDEELRLLGVDPDELGD